MTTVPVDTSLRDNVTGLYSKSYLFERLTQAMARAQRERKTLVLILWDIDGFVQFNNLHGQKDGDTFLTKVSDRIKKSLRVYDEAFRSGPDEFCALLTPADDVVAQEVTARVKTFVSSGLFDADSEYANQKFSISSGYVVYPSEDNVAEALFHSAQQALYKDKRKPK